MAEGEIVIPQPLEVTSYPFKNRNALIADIAIKLFVNTDLTQIPGSVEDQVKKCVVNAEKFVMTANSKYIDSLCAE